MGSKGLVAAFGRAGWSQVKPKPIQPDEGGKHGNS